MTLRTTPSRPARRMILWLTGLAMSLVIAACGGSSTSTGAKTATSTTAATSASAGTSAQRAAFVKCLQQHGVTPPRAAGGGTQTTRTGPPPAGSGGGNSTHQAAFKACRAAAQPNPG